MEFLEFRTFWDNEINKKLFRYSKEFEFYEKLKKILGPKQKSNLLNIFTSVMRNLISNNAKVIEFTREHDFNNVSRKYSVCTAINDKRHFSQILVFQILRKCSLQKEIFMEVFEKMDEEIFKGHRAQAFFREKYDLVITFFK